MCLFLKLVGPLTEFRSARPHTGETALKSKPEFRFPCEKICFVFMHLVATQWLTSFLFYFRTHQPRISLNSDPYTGNTLSCHRHRHKKKINFFLVLSWLHSGLLPTKTWQNGSVAVTYYKWLMVSFLLYYLTHSVQSFFQRSKSLPLIAASP